MNKLVYGSCIQLKLHSKIINEIMIIIKKMDYGTVYYNMQIKFLMFNENKFRKQESNYDL